MAFSVDQHAGRPDWCLLNGIYFSRRDLDRRVPAWWWGPRRREAWRLYRQRLVIVSREIEVGHMSPAACWAEIRSYVLNGDRGAFHAALEMTRHADRAGVLTAAIGMKLGDDTLARIVAQYESRVVSQYGPQSVTVD